MTSNSKYLSIEEIDFILTDICNIPYIHNSYKLNLSNKILDIDILPSTNTYKIFIFDIRISIYEELYNIKSIINVFEKLSKVFDDIIINNIINNLKLYKSNKKIKKLLD